MADETTRHTEAIAALYRCCEVDNEATAKAEAAAVLVEFAKNKTIKEDDAYTRARRRMMARRTSPARDMSAVKQELNLDWGQERVLQWLIGGKKALPFLPCDRTWTIDRDHQGGSELEI